MSFSALRELSQLQKDLCLSSTFLMSGCGGSSVFVPNERILMLRMMEVISTLKTHFPRVLSCTEFQKDKTCALRWLVVMTNTGR